MTLAIFYALSCSLFWAGTTIASKNLALAMPSMVFAFLRYFIACLCLLPFVSRHECKNLTPKNIGIILFLGFSFILLFNLFFLNALYFSSATAVTLIAAINPVLTLLISSIIYAQIPKKSQLLAFILSFAGVTMIITKGNFGFEVLTGNIGEFLMLGAVLSQISYALALRKINHSFTPIFLSFATGICGILLLIPIVLNRELFVILQQLTFSHWLSVLYVGILGTPVGLILYSLSIKRVGPATTNLLIFSTMPIFVGILAFFLLGERMTIWHALGGSLVIGSLVLGLRHRD